ncbi:hypothetical protein [Cryobacterium lactosi]|nr:hypothetical protein [Cryobacterium lactosi]
MTDDVGAIAALLAQVTVGVERRAPDTEQPSTEQPTGEPPAPAGTPDAS